MGEGEGSNGALSADPSSCDVPKIFIEDEEGLKRASSLTIQTAYRSSIARRKSHGWLVLLDSLKTEAEVIHQSDPKNELHDLKWKRVVKKLSKVGKGLAIDGSARILLTDHWLEVADAKHRYGSLLSIYHEAWRQSNSEQNFFFWLDYGDGKTVDLAPRCPRSKLEENRVKYLGPGERSQYIVTIQNGRLYYDSTSPSSSSETVFRGDLIDTEEENGKEKAEKWIFVVDPKGTLYVARKVRGKFHHSSFLAGGPAKAAGNLTVKHGVLTRISPSSGHYRPNAADLAWFLELLNTRGVDLTRVAIENLD